MWLPAGRRQLGNVWLGILATLVLWLACGFTFRRYLSDFAYTYVTYYAGLASAMIALVFLYHVPGFSFSAANSTPRSRASGWQIRARSHSAVHKCPFSVSD